jgi:hypothetical protein
MRQGVFSGGAVVACTAALLVPSAAGAGTIDQQQPNTPGSALQIQGNQSVAQTFTAGISGQIDQVDLGLLKGGAPGDLTSPLTVEIRDAPGGTPGATVLGSGTVLPSSVTTSTASFIPVTIASTAAVAAGTQYAIVAYSAEPNVRHYDWAQAGSNPYAAGGVFYAASSPPSTTWNAFAGFDFAFKTYVLAPPSPGKTASKKCKKKRKGKKKSAASAKKKKCKKKKKKKRK